MTEPAIELRDLVFSWDGATSALRVPNLSIQHGERVFIQGASGSGKSTLLGLIGGVLAPQSGEIRVIGTPLHSMRGADRDRFRAAHVGFIFQMFNLIPYLSVTANVLLPLQFSPARRDRLAGTDAELETKRLLHALGLNDPGLLNRPVTQLSIGQQQRVAAARSLIGRPQIIIADEPTSALDEESRADFLDLLMSECEEHSVTLLFVSHDSILGNLFDRRLRMSELTLRECTSP
jgi:putative ABC transport system ATP-binding protein